MRSPLLSTSTCSRFYASFSVCNRKLATVSSQPRIKIKDQLTCLNIVLLACTGMPYFSVIREVSSSSVTFPSPFASNSCNHFYFTDYCGTDILRISYVICRNTFIIHTAYTVYGIQFTVHLPPYALQYNPGESIAYCNLFIVL